jgi:hypothetical protein
MEELIYLKSTLKAMSDERFDCNACLSKYRDKEMTDKYRESKACENVASEVRHHVSQFKFRKCVGNFVRPSASALIGLHSHYQKGHLPFPGSVMDQPAKIMEAFQVIDNHYYEQALEQRKKAEQASKSGGRRGR